MPVTELNQIIKRKEVYPGIQERGVGCRGRDWGHPHLRTTDVREARKLK